MMKKRPGIQGLRAWAIIAVLLFHFFPALLPQGFLGVDVFLVLSGFLISLVLDKQAVASSTYTSFYFKRMRRIFPLLLLIVLCCSIFSTVAFGDMLLQYSKRSALHAALFITNLKADNEGEDYFRKLEKVDDFYTHTWSLSVEVQFYLLAPLLLHSAKVSRRFARYSMELLLFAATMSWAYSKILAPTAAFYSTTARLWQFLAGAIAFRLQNMQHLPIAREGAKSSSHRLVVPSAFALLAIVFDFTFSSTESAIRDAVTFATAALLVLQIKSQILTHTMLQMIGDCSYSLYLIHWPVACWLKMNQYEHWTARLLTLVASVVASIAVYNLYEKWYLSLREKSTLILIGMLYLSCGAVYLSRYVDDVGSSPGKEMGKDATKVKPLSYDEAKAINVRMDLQWLNNLRFEHCTVRDPKVDINPFGFCNLPPGTGNLSMLIIGNSFAANHGRMIVEHLKQHYSKIAAHAAMGCEALIVSPFCKDMPKPILHEDWLRDIDSFMPDVLFIMTRFIEPNNPLGAGTISDDEEYKTMMRNLRRYEAKVKKVFILQALPHTADLQKIEDARMEKGKSVSEYMEEATDMDAVPMRKRVEELAKHCEKCVVFDLMQLHMSNGRFMTSDPMTHLHYFESSGHHTPIGLKLVEPLYRKMAENFDDLLVSKWPENVLTMT